MKQYHILVKSHTDYPDLDIQMTAKGKEDLKEKFAKEYDFELMNSDFEEIKDEDHSNPEELEDRTEAYRDSVRESYHDPVVPEHYENN